jgi:penicillin-binding protein 1C
MKLYLRLKNKCLIRYGLAILIGFILLPVILDRLVFPLPLENLHKPSSTFVYSRNKTLLSAYAASDTYWRKPVKLSEISPLLVKSVLACEDRWFYYHPGVNLFSLIGAAFDDVKAGKIVRGGSTITMQIARMMEPKERTFLSKFIEVLRAFQLEMHYSKRELLELYFNLAPYGGNIEGVGAASYFYFGKTPYELSASQAALLVSIPNSPSALRPDLYLEKSLKARRRVLGVMRSQGIISKEKYAEALQEEIKAKRYEPPSYAPHLCRDLALKNPGTPEIVSTIDLRDQAICERIMRNHKGELRAKGIGNAAVVVLKNSTCQVLAMVGSIDFNDQSNQGQVNGATSPRSPGSTLKPFLYAMALDKGLCTPASMLEDLPVYFSGYSPENYDQAYRGAASMAEALRLSLNIPAVTICSEVGLGDFYQLLKSGGFTTLYRKDYEYGLPIILGACEVELVELSALYSSLARGGLFIPYQTEIQAKANSNDTTRLFSDGAAYIISDILGELQRPDFPSSWEFAPDIPKVAWKTGTSYGRKDAWSIGYDPDYTIGIWTGNFSGASSPDLVGAEAAAPILFEIFKAIENGNTPGWFAQPEDVATRMVCAKSGLPPNQYCPTTISELYLPGVSAVDPCEIHKMVLVDSTTGYRLCRFCSAGKKVIQKVYENWPPKLATWFAQSGKLTQAIPGHNPECTGTYAGDSPVIVSPNDDATYILRTYLPAASQEIALQASAASGASQLYWFVDGELYGRAKPGDKLFYIPKIGIHKLTCSDDEGRSSSVTLHIE